MYYPLVFSILHLTIRIRENLYTMLCEEICAYKKDYCDKNGKICESRDMFKYFVRVRTEQGKIVMKVELKTFIRHLRKVLVLQSATQCPFHPVQECYYTSGISGCNHVSIRTRR